MTLSKAASVVSITIIGALDSSWRGGSPFVLERLAAMVLWSGAHGLLVSLFASGSQAANTARLT